MPELYSSTSQTSSNPHSSYLATATILTCILVLNECIYLFNIPNIVSRIGLSFALIFAVIYIAFRYGLWPAMSAACFANIYILYAFGGPGRNIASAENMLKGEWLLALLFFLPAATIGYLRDKVNQLLQQERLARQEAEEGRLQLERVLEEMPVGVAIAKAPTGEISFSNRYLDQLVGHPLIKSLSLSDNPSSAIVDREGKTLPQELWPLHRVITNEETLSNEEYAYHTDTNQYTLQIKGVPIYNNQGKLVSGIIMADDITAEKELMQRKDDFLSLVSHELKTPVTSLKIYSQLVLKKIEKDPLYNPLAELRKIENQTQKIQKIINNMMDIAAIQLQKDIIQTEILELSEVIQDIHIAFPARELDVKHIESASILGDKARLAQVMTNLLSNAIKYSPENAPIIIKSTVKNDQVNVAIQDFGIGISPKDQHKIFNRFYQEQQKDGKVYQGLGIGLYFSAEIIKQHHGKIWVDSKKGKGSTFFIALPLTPKISQTKT